MLFFAFFCVFQDDSQRTGEEPVIRLFFVISWLFIDFKKNSSVCIDDLACCSRISKTVELISYDRYSSCSFCQLGRTWLWTV